MKVKILTPTKFYNGDKLVAEGNYHGPAFASGKFEITEEQANKARMMRDINKYLKRHTETWENFIDYIERN